MCEIMESVFHGPLECSTKCFNTEWHNPIGEGSPWSGECNSILVCMDNMDLIVAAEDVHK